MDIAGVAVDGWGRGRGDLWAVMVMKVSLASKLLSLCMARFVINRGTVSLSGNI